MLASQFRGLGSENELVLDVPTQTGLDLGRIGGWHGEVISISNAFGTRVVIVLTVATAHGATVHTTRS